VSTDRITATQPSHCGRTATSFRITVIVLLEKLQIAVRFGDPGADQMGVT
jgi:hypothetical protein